LGVTIALHSYKGGTGKTILSLNLAETLRQRKKNVCLFDYDFRAPSLHVWFKTIEVKHWLNDFLNGECDVKDVLFEASSEHENSCGQFLVGLANPSSKAIREISSKSRRWEMKALGKLLSTKIPLFNDLKIDYLILDTSPGLAYSSINAMVSSDVTLVVATTELSDIEGTRSMIHELYDLFDKKTAIILNRIMEPLMTKDELQKLYDGVDFLDAIPCFCDVQRARGGKIFVSEKPDHPFTKILEHMTSKIESWFEPPIETLPELELLRRYRDMFLKKTMGIHMIDEKSQEGT
jgi:septum site-determining protein MinD